MPNYGWRKQSKCFFDSDRCFEVRRIWDIRVRDIEIPLYIPVLRGFISISPSTIYLNFCMYGIFLNYFFLICMHDFQHYKVFGYGVTEKVFPTLIKASMAFGGISSRWKIKSRSSQVKSRGQKHLWPKFLLDINFWTKSTLYQKGDNKGSVMSCLLRVNSS